MSEWNLELAVQSFGTGPEGVGAVLPARLEAGQNTQVAGIPKLPRRGG